MLKKIMKFTTSMFNAAWIEIKRFTCGLWENLEAVTLLVLAAIGLTHLLSELPFYVALPMWVEGTLVIPVLSTLIIWSLTKIITLRFYLYSGA